MAPRDERGLVLVGVCALLLACTGSGGEGGDASVSMDSGEPDGAQPDAGEPFAWPIERISVGTGGFETDHGSDKTRLSLDGRFALFASRAPNLGSSGNDIFLRDRQSDTTTLISANDDGEAIGAIQGIASMSSDQALVVFVNQYRSLDPVASSSRAALLRDLGTGTTSIVSLNEADENVNGSIDDPVLSADGRCVVFASTGINLSGPGSQEHIYVRDLVNESTVHVSRTPVEAASAACSLPDISSDGSRIAFESAAQNLHPEAFTFRQIFVTDRVNGTPVMASVSNTGEAANSISQQAALSGDGRYVAFQSSATNLVSGADSGLPHIYLHDTQTSMTVVASVDAEGNPAGGALGPVDVSDDGRYVVYTTNDFGDPGDDNGAGDVYRFDRTTGLSTRVSFDYEKGQPSRTCSWPAISGDGSVVSFSTTSPGMVPSKTTAAEDAYAVTMPE